MENILTTNSIFNRLVEILDTNYGYVDEEKAEEVAKRLMLSGLIREEKPPTAQPEKTCKYWDSESKFCSLCRPSAQSEHEYMMEEFMYGQDMGNTEDGSL